MSNVMTHNVGHAETHGYERQAYQILDEEIRRTLGSLLSENLRL